MARMDNPNKELNNSQISQVSYQKSEAQMQQAIEDRIRKQREKEEKAKIREEEDFRINLRKNGLKLTAQEEKKYIEQFRKLQELRTKQEYKQKLKDALNIEKEVEKKRREMWEEERKEREEMYRSILKNENASLKEKLTAVGNLYKEWLDGGGLNKALNDKMNSFISGASNTMNQIMSTYSKYQSTINTRLQGTDKTFQKLQGRLLNSVGINPYVKTQSLLDNLQALVQTGISFNLEQRAFLQTVKDKVADTFDVANSSLLRIVKLQQADSSASRLGMESYLTSFLNNMFENTEYLTNSFDSVTSALVEATSQMSTESGVQFEYIVQKWLGSLSSVGLSDTTVSNLAQAMGYLATGNVSGLESSGMQNLIVMAASRAGLSYADMLTRGISLNETNNLLEAVVGYLQEIGSSTNQVVKNQYASTFGVSISDLRAASNLRANDITNISNNLLSYGGSIQNLQNQMWQLAGRTSLAEMLNNVKSNAEFSLFSNIASNPALYALWSVTDMLQSYTGGINIPSIFALGTGVDLNTTVENLMKLGIMGIGSLGMIGDIVSGVGNTFGMSSALASLGIGSNIIGTSRGTGLQSLSSGYSTSTSSYIGQSSGSAFYESTLNKAENDANQKLENSNATSGKDIADMLSHLDTNVQTLTDVITSVVSGNTITVSVDNYGLVPNV